MWAVLGLVVAAFTAIFALFRSRAAAANYYASQVYGMTPRVHRIYAVLALTFVLLFAAALFITWIPAVPLLAACVLVGIFYFSSFARGFSDEP